MHHNLYIMDSIFGWLATAGTFIYKIPQIYKLYKTKKSNDVSSASLIIQTTGYVLYIIHGFVIDDHPTIAMGGLSLVQGSILVVLDRLYKTRDEEVGEAGDVVAGAELEAADDVVEMVVL